MNMLHTLDTKK